MVIRRKRSAFFEAFAVPAIGTLVETAYLDLVSAFSKNFSHARFLPIWRERLMRTHAIDFGVHVVGNEEIALRPDGQAGRTAIAVRASPLLISRCEFHPLR